MPPTMGRRVPTSPVGARLFEPEQDRQMKAYGSKGRLRSGVTLRLNRK